MIMKISAIQSLKRSKWLDRQSFFVRLFSVFLVLIIFSLLLSSTVSYKYSASLLSQELEHSQTILLNQAKETIERQIIGINDIMVQISYDADSQRLYYMSRDQVAENQVRIRDYLQKIRYLKTTNPLVENISVVFHNSGMVCSTIGSHTQDFYFGEVSRYSNSRISDFVMLNKYSNLQYITTAPVKYEHETINIVSFGAKLTTAPEPYATILIDVRENDLLKLIRDIDSELPVAFMILNDRNQLISMYQNIFTNEDSEQFAKEVLSQKISLEDSASLNSIKLLGEKYNVFFPNSSRSTYQYISLIPQRYINDRVAYIRLINFLSTLLVAVAGIVFSYYVTRRLYSPIKEILSLIQISQPDRPVDRSEGKNEFFIINQIIQYITERNSQLQKTIEHDSQVYLNRMRTDILNGVFSYHQSEYRDVHASLDYSYSTFLVAVLDFSSDHFKWMPSQREDFLHFFDEYKAKIKNEALRLDIVDKQGDAFPIILNYEPSDAGSGLINELLNELLKKSMEISSQFVTMGIGNAYVSLQQVHLSYIEALSALKLKSSMGENRIIYIDELDNDQLSPVISYSLDEERALANCIKLGDFNAVSNMVEEILQNNSKITNPKLVEHLLTLLLNSGHRTLIDFDSSAPNMSAYSIYTSLHNARDYTEQREILIQYLKSITELAKSNRKNQNRKILEKAYAFIQEHYQGNVSLQILEEHIGVSSSYISYIFSQNGSENFLDYLNRFRIDKSKELLAKTNMNIYSVAEQVGIPSVNSFNRIFKKYEGITPGQFRNTLS